MVHFFIRKTLLAASLAILAGNAIADVVVVVHPSNTSAIDSKSVQRIFLGKEKKFSNGSGVNPINQTNNATRNDFDSNVLGRSSSQVAAYWSKLVFTGKGIPPNEVGGDAEVIAAVAADPSAIGYVDSAAVTGDVKTIPLN
ncbi:phosphate ABC transporter substrate-binding protein [Aliiglaciecola litoralis]|uniref:Phosphate ABC transporter substrate-binding protein n=1 Tax=Aliiglaciecola litoralis TaxID=582857 RepID=A0ABP3X6G6_9ALTE